MKRKHNITGFSLFEVTIAVSIVVILTGLAIPAVMALYESFHNDNGAITTISTAMTVARATAARERRYAGIRLQQDKDGEQYIVFIVHNPDKTGLSTGFTAIEGQKPIKLPAGTLVTDLRVRVNHGSGSLDAESVLDGPLNATYLDNTNSTNLGPDGKNIYITDMTCFSIIFSPNGSLIIHDVRTRNKEGIYRPDLTIPAKISKDDIFNSPESIHNAGAGMFIQDDYAQLGLGAEPSRNMFISYDKNHFDKLSAQDRLNYLISLSPTYINPYTGTIINR
jgi:hypothetical protein